MTFLILIFIYFACINLFTYRAFARDKRSAITQEHRTPETRLLFWAAIGGWPAAKFAQHKLRHKTTKQPFGRELNNIGVVQGLAAITLLVVIFGMTLATPDFSTVTVTSKAAPQAVQPADGLLGVSLRPPAARPAN